MDIHQTEEQQVEAIKSFWQENGNAIIVGLGIGLAGFVGLNFYKEHKLEQELQTSESYQVMIEDVAKDSAGFAAAGSDFIANNKDSAYASLTAIALAKEAAVAKDWTAVEQHLTTAIETASDNSIKAIATVRLARVQLQLEKYDQALTTLSAELPEAFNASVSEVKGDIYLKQDKRELARNAYQVAIDTAGQGGNPVLQMKLDDLAQAVNLSK